MKKAAGIQFLLCSLFSFLSATSWSLEDVRAQATEQNLRVLSGRIHKILEYRLEGLNHCDSSSRGDIEVRFKHFPKYSDQQDIVLNLIDLYLETYKVVAPCFEKLALSENIFHQAERKKFKSFANLSKVSHTLRQIFDELDPNCISVQVPNKYGVYDPFPCMAGESMLANTLGVSGEGSDFYSETTKFINNLKQSIADQSEVPSSIDLYQNFLGESSDNISSRERFLATITALTSSTSSLNSYIQGYHFYFFHKVLLRTGSAEQALLLFQNMRLHVDEFRTLMAAFQRRNLRTVIGVQTVSRANHHDLMAAYMACHYREKSWVYRQWLPVALGYAYETYDFKAHVVNDKAGVRESLRGFRVDTRRHQAGVKWGSQFCGVRP